MTQEPQAAQSTTKQEWWEEGFVKKYQEFINISVGMNELLSVKDKQVNIFSSIENFVKSFISHVASEEYERGKNEERKRCLEETKQQAQDLRNAKIDSPTKEDWNNALEQSACKLEALIEQKLKE